MSIARIPHHLAVLFATALFFSACAAPPSSGDPVPYHDVSPAAATPAIDPMNLDSVLPPEGKPVQVDTSCKTDADCTVKDVGNCCGYYPACVNVNSPTDPEGVRAACAKSGTMSVCGFRDIQACQCVEGTCKAQSTALPAVK